MVFDLPDMIRGSVTGRRVFDVMTPHRQPPTTPHGARSAGRDAARPGRYFDAVHTLTSSGQNSHKPAGRHHSTITSHHGVEPDKTKQLQLCGYRHQAKDDCISERKGASKMTSQLHGPFLSQRSIDQEKSWCISEEEYPSECRSLMTHWDSFHVKYDEKLNINKGHCSDLEGQHDEAFSVSSVSSDFVEYTIKKTVQDAMRDSWSDSGRGSSFYDLSDSLCDDDLYRDDLHCSRADQTYLQPLSSSPESDCDSSICDPVYETIPDDAILSDYGGKDQSVPSVSSDENIYDTIDVCQLLDTFHNHNIHMCQTPPKLPARTYPAGREKLASTADKLILNDNIKVKSRQSKSQLDNVHIDDIVKDSDIVDMDGYHRYTVSDVMHNLQILAAQIEESITEVCQGKQTEESANNHNMPYQDSSKHDSAICKRYSATHKDGTRHKESAKNHSLASQYVTLGSATNRRIFSVNKVSVNNSTQANISLASDALKHAKHEHHKDSIVPNIKHLASSTCHTDGLRQRRPDLTIPQEITGEDVIGRLHNIEKNSLDLDANRKCFSSDKPLNNTHKLLSNLGRYTGNDPIKVQETRVCMRKDNTINACQTNPPRPSALSKHNVCERNQNAVETQLEDYKQTRSPENTQFAQTALLREHKEFRSNRSEDNNANRPEADTRSLASGHSVTYAAMSWCTTRAHNSSHNTTRWSQNIGQLQGTLC